MYVKNSSGTTLAAISSGGNLGIGDSSPQVGLSLYGNGNISRIKIATTSNHQLNIGEWDGSTHRIEGDANRKLLITSYSSDGIHLGGSGSSHVVIKGGNVGIGTLTPPTPLTVFEGTSAVAMGEYQNGAVIWIDGANGDFTGGDYFNIRANNSAQLTFGYAGGESVYLASNGRLSIGTSSPVAKLDVRGDLIVDATNNNYGGVRIHDDSSGDYNVYLDMGRNQGNTRFHIRNAGRTAGTTTWASGNDVAVFSAAKCWIPQASVGIGTDSPLANLMVGADVRNAGAAVQDQAGYFIGTKTAFGGSGNKGLWMNQLHVADDSALAAGIGGAITFGATQDNTNGTYLASIEGSRDNATSGQYGASMIFRTRTNGSAVMGEHMVINSVGNVGIGTNSPRGPIEIYAASDSTLVIERYTSNGIKLRADDYNNSPIRLAFEAWVYDFRTGSGTSRLHIDAGGNVGIGTNAPSYLLDLESTATGLTHNLKLNKSSTTDDYAEIAFQLWSGAGTGLNTFGGSGNSRPSVVLRALNESGSNAAGAFVVGTFTGGSTNSTLTEKFRINSAGNVGIGTNNPSKALHVIGAAFIDNTESTEGLTVEATTNASITLQAAQNTAYHAKLSAHYNYTTPMTLRGYGGTVLAQNTGVTKTLLYANNAEQIRITTTGVGIGLGGSDPTTKLTVSNSSGNIFTLLGQSASNVFNVGATGVTQISGATGNSVLVVSNSGSGAYMDIGSNALFVKKDGNVGIGTNNPSAPLTIRSTTIPQVVMGYPTGTNEHRFYWDSSKVYLSADHNNSVSNSAMIFSVDGSERIRIQSNGYVGIGTATAWAPLQVYSSDDQKILLSGSANPYIRWQNGGSNRAYIQWIEGQSALTFVNALGDNFDFLPHDSTGALALRLRGNDSDVWGYVYAYEGTGAAHEVGFLDGDGAWAARHVKDTSWEFKINNSSKMFINSNGSVGVGNAGTNVYKTLQVSYVSTSTDVTQEGLSGGATGKGIMIYNSQGSDNVYANLDFRARNADGRIAYQYQNATNVGDFHFITDNTGSPQSMMTIKNDGEVRLVNKLLVQNSSSSSEINIYKSAGSNTDSAILRVGYDSTNSFAISRQRASSAIYLNSGQSGSTVYHQIASSTKMTVNATGVGVGTVSASGRLHVYRTADTVPGLLCDANRDGARINFNYSSSTTTFGEIGMTHYGSSGDCQIWMGANLNSNSSSHSGPAVGVAGSSSTSWYTVWNTQTSQDFYGIYRRSNSPSASYSNYFRIKSDGNVGINTTNPTDRFHVRSIQSAGNGSGSNLAALSLETYNSNSSSYGSYVKCKNYGGGGGGPDWKIGGIEGYWTTNKVASIDFMTGDDWHNPGNKDEGEIAFTVYNNTGSGSTAIEAMRIHQTGNIGIGSTNPGSKLTVNGSFSASSKSFLIDHPTKENKKLEHGCLEGPEFGVYHRGATQSNTITLPDYWSGLVREDTVTVQLTPRGGFQHLYVVSTSLSQIVIGAADGETIDCFYTIYGERADIDSLVVEKDV